ncbi:hypothetical protein B0O99DRAFT_741269 [Bisporella sp. PMI_857]|nr:hypothetical protein B0O99DRAFT_741269 [Bisporella sp. PMI_857]
MEPIRVAVYKERKTIPFAKLDETSFYIGPAAKTYWQYLTIGAYKVYEEIHGLCASPNSTSGMVHVKNFLQHMKHVANPNQDIVLMTWKRLLRQGQQDSKLFLNTIYSKFFDMVVLYMLHIELCIKNKMPVLKNGETGIDMDRREALKRFTKWVPCICQASSQIPYRNEWNFANDTGLSKRKTGIARLSNISSQTRFRVYSNRRSWTG